MDINSEFNLSTLKKTWESQYDGENVTALKDHNLFEIETSAIISEINKHIGISEQINILEIGCGAGELLRRVYANLSTKDINFKLCGVDFSENAILTAKRKSNSNIDFYSADFKSFFSNINNNKFDIIISQRSIMALMDLDSQVELLSLIKKSLNDKAIGIVSECFQEDLERFNKHRVSAGLSEIEKVWHSNYLNEDMFSSMFSNVHSYHYCSTYMLTTRIIYPMFDNPKHNQKIHQYAAGLPESGDYSFLKMLVFEK